MKLAKSGINQKAIIKQSGAARCFTKSARSPSCESLLSIVSNYSTVIRNLLANSTKKIHCAIRMMKTRWVATGSYCTTDTFAKFPTARSVHCAFSLWRKKATFWP